MRTLSLFLALLAGCTDATSEGDGDPTDDTAVIRDTGDVDCDGTDGAEAVACAARAFLATLDDDQFDLATYAFTNSEAKTRWSNLPPGNVTRSGITQGDLSTESLEAMHVLAQTVLSDAGYEDFVGVLAADDYLGNQGGGGGPGGGSGTYASTNYIVAIYGTPSVDGDWMLQLGGHHMAYNLTYRSGTASPTPNHLGSEPKSAFTLDGESYTPVVGEGAAFVALFESLDATELQTAYLSGQSFADVVLGPDEYGTGSYDAVVFPTGSQRSGILASALDASQQALVTAAIAQWVEDYDSSIADDLMAAYTSSTAYADTYVAWGGNASGPDIDVNGTYFRIDGPRLWLEVAVQNGVIIQNETHYHTIYRDKAYDYGDAL